MNLTEHIFLPYRTYILEDHGRPWKYIRGGRGGEGEDTGEKRGQKSIEGTKREKIVTNCMLLERKNVNASQK